MAGYDLDEKSGLFGMFGGLKSPGKIMKKDDSIELKHYSMHSCIRANAAEVREDSIRVQSKDSIVEVNLFQGDPVIINFTANQELYVISGEISQVNSLTPLDVSIIVVRIEKLKDSRRFERYSVSLTGSIKIVGVPENKFAIVKNISFGGIKVNCKEDIMLEDLIDVLVILDKTDKLSFKGKVVRKNRQGDHFEYGIEMNELGESNMRNLHHFINQFKFA